MAANLMPSNPVNMMSPNSPDPMAVNLMPSYYMNLMPANLMEPLVKWVSLIKFMTLRILTCSNTYFIVEATKYLLSSSSTGEPQPLSYDAFCQHYSAKKVDKWKVQFTKVVRQHTHTHANRLYSAFCRELTHSSSTALAVNTLYICTVQSG